jgi:hypothetical protein
MSDIRSRLIRLAHTNPELRADILPLVASTDRTAGWTRGVFDRAEIDEILAMVWQTIHSAQSRIRGMLAENAQYASTYSMAGLEYREEQKAARESRAMLTDALRKLEEAGRKL